MESSRKTIENDKEFLRQVSVEVDFENDNYLEWIAQIKNYCQNDAVYALAPVQIGIPKRIIYLRNTTPNMEKILTQITMRNKFLLIHLLLVKKVILNF